MDNYKAIASALDDFFYDSDSEEEGLVEIQRHFALNQGRRDRVLRSLQTLLNQTACSEHHRLVEKHANLVVADEQEALEWLTWLHRSLT